MILPLKFVFRMTGMLPAGTNRDMYFLLLPLSIYIWLLATSANKLIFWNFTNLKLEFDVVIDVIFCAGGLFMVIKTHKYKDYFTDMLKHCLGPQSLFKTDLSILLALILNLVFRFCFTVLKGSFFENAIYEITMSFLYTPTALHIFTVCQLKERFSALNTMMRELSESARNSSPTDFRADLSSLFQTHLRLRKLINQVNSYWGVFNAIIFFLRVLCLTFIAHCLLDGVRDPELAVEPKVILVFGIVAMVIAVQCDVCQRCVCEVSGYRHTLQPLQ